MAGAVSSICWFILFFSLAGIFIAWEDTVEGITVRDYVEDVLAGTAYGILCVVNGIGDFASSLIDCQSIWSTTAKQLKSVQTFSPSLRPRH